MRDHARHHHMHLRLVAIDIIDGILDPADLQSG
jgi:hypothetical protein